MQGLSEEALQELLASVEEMTAATEALFESAAPPSPRAGRPARGRGPAKPASRRRRAAAASSESEDEVLTAPHLKCYGSYLRLMGCHCPKYLSQSALQIDNTIVTSDGRC